MLLAHIKLKLKGRGEEASVVVADAGDFSVVRAGSVTTRAIPQGVITTGNGASLIKGISSFEMEYPTLLKAKRNWA